MEIFGYAAAVFTTLSFVPQVVRVLKTRSTRDISMSMFIILSMGLLCWLIYGAAIANVPMILANSTTLVLALIILVYKIIYG